MRRAVDDQPDAGTLQQIAQPRVAQPLAGGALVVAVAPRTSHAVDQRDGCAGAPGEQLGGGQAGVPGAQDHDVGSWHGVLAASTMRCRRRALCDSAVTTRWRPASRGSDRQTQRDGATREAKPAAGGPATEVFVAHRNLLFTVAYELLGSADADVLQETWLRWAGVDLDAVQDRRAYLVRITARQALSGCGRSAGARSRTSAPGCLKPLLTAPDVAEDVEAGRERLDGDAAGAGDARAD